MTSKRLTPAGSEIVGALSDFYNTLKEGGGEAVARRFTVRTVELDLEPRNYNGEDVKRVRKMLGLSQALFARFLGASVGAVRSWENGGKKPSNIVCRFLDEISLRPEAFRERIREALVPKPRGQEPIGSSN